MRCATIVIGLVCTMLVACAQPALVSCPDSSTVCPDGCVDLAADPLNCGACGLRCNTNETCANGQCLPGGAGACAIDNGGCSQDALCMDTGGSIECLCMPGFTGDGISCAACTMCAPTQFASAPCSPLADTVCTLCSTTCPESMFESQPCSPLADRACSPCTFCGPGQYTAASCTPTANTICATCDPGCLSCSGPGPTCTLCDNGLVLSNGACVPAVCGNGVIEPGEECDDNNMAIGDGCNANCMVEGGSYCFGEVLSTCRPGTCVTDSATALPLSAAFSLDGAGTASSAGLHLSQRSMIRTTAAVTYPVLVEATVVYTGNDVTYAGTRGDGLRDATASDEPTDPLRARLTASTVELATGPGTTQIASTSTGFTPTNGVPYRVRFVDDGFSARVEWFNTTNLAEGVGLQQLTSYHGSDDRAFVGGGDQAAVTISNIRVCSAPTVPVTSGLVAHYSAIPSWTVATTMAGAVTSWDDQVGGHTLSTAATSPTFVPSINAKASVDFNGGGGLSTSAFALTTDVSVFVVVFHRSSPQWGAIAHHGNRDSDWSMEQNGSLDGNVLHWQTNNDNTNMNLTLAADTPYVLTGIFNGNARYFSSTAFDGTTNSASITDASHTITAGSKQMFVGLSDAGEASNAAIGELVYYNRALSTAERDAVIAYLQALWRP